MDAVEEVKNRLSIEDVISEYVQLKRSGRNWKGLSPFGNEKTPSFMVSPEKQIWHDFSSGKGGNMFSFVMEVEGLDFKGALELLARKAGVDLEQYRQVGVRGPSSHKKERLYEALELATKFYQTQFSKSQVALEYVIKKRAFTKETALEWRLGYSPNNGTALVDFLTGRGYTENEIKLAGLSSKNYRGLGDMFRGRLMIPLCDPQGRVIGFTARLLADDADAPKYINTPSTPLYDKSRHVFGLHLAKEAIRKGKYVVLAEGNLDVIASHQAGVRQVVATAGTALTEPHLKALSRFTGDIRLCFDADKAGLAATERAIPIAAKVGVSLSIITIPSGKDPDELIRQSADTWREIIERPQYAVDWLIDHYQTVLDVQSAQGKREFSDVVLTVVHKLPDSVEQDHYIGRLADILQVSKAALSEKLTGQTGETARLRRVNQEAIEQKSDATTVEQRKTEEHLLALALMQPKLRSYIETITPEMMVAESSRDMLAFLQEHPDFAGAGAKTAEAKMATEQLQMQNLSEYGKILALVYETLYEDLEPLELGYEATRLQAKLVEQYVRTQKHRLSKKLQSVTDTEAQVLLREVKQLDELLSKYQGGSTRGKE